MFSSLIDQYRIHRQFYTLFWLIVLFMLPSSYLVSSTSSSNLILWLTFLAVDILDPALIRPGRIDRKVNYVHCRNVLSSVVLTSAWTSPLFITFWALSIVWHLCTAWLRLRVLRNLHNAHILSSACPHVLISSLFVLFLYLFIHLFIDLFTYSLICLLFCGQLIISNSN